jgi:TonB family protein
MSYRALLFCPDEAAARLVTQVLSELEFTVELSFEPFVTVQKLAAEPFDSVVVDCANEENAALLFKGARNSTLNHSSLCVAVVDSQMGVAKAFRIGANLVLTKPINIEQSKGTLRVARGLLRKGEAKPRAATEPVSVTNAATSPTPSSLVASLPNVASSIAASAASSESAAAATAVTVPSSLFEAQQATSSPAESEKASHPKANPDFVISKPVVADETLTAQSKSASDRFAGAVSTSGAAAAPALAPESPKPLPSSFKSKMAGAIKTAPPLASQDTIVPQKRFPEPVAVRVPTFSSYALPASPKPRDGNKIFWWFLCIVILAPTGYFGWQKLQPLRYIHRAPAISTQPTSAPAQPAGSDSAPVNAIPAGEPQPGAASVPATETGSKAGAPIIANGAPEGFPTKETIDVGQTVDAPEPAITVVAKPEPLQVKQKPAEPIQAQPTPPSLVLSESKATDSALAGIISSNVAVPKPAPGALQVSEGVTQGLLIKKIAPLYPATALKLRKQGAVELMATVSKTGTITKIKVLDGDSLLAQAAIDAVRQWKYRPFLLNAEPVDIETQITIKFKLPN